MSQSMTEPTITALAGALAMCVSTFHAGLHVHREQDLGARPDHSCRQHDRNAGCFPLETLASTIIFQHVAAQ